jgi:outer membrane protein assembly factor BamB
MVPSRVKESIGPVVVIATLLAGCGHETRRDAAGATDAAAQAAALHDAARAGDVAEARRLVEEVGVPVDAGDRYDSTALLFAANRGHLEMVRYLIEAGADVDHRETFFNTSAFDYAVWQEHDEVQELLIAAGADQREEALELAAQAERPELARVAVKAGPIQASTLESLRARDDLPAEVRAALSEARSRPDPEPPSYDAEALTAFEGTFETHDASDGSGSEVTARVESTGSALSIRVGDREPVEVTPSGERTFRSADGTLVASFWGRLGSVESLTLQLAGLPPARMRPSVAEPLGPAAFHATSVPAEAAHDDNWPQFRGAHAEGLGSGSGYATVWDLDDGSGVRWQVELPGLGNSSPIVWGERVIVTTAVAEGIEQGVQTGLTGAGDSVDEEVEHSWRVMAFDKRSGAPLWNTEVGRGVPLTKRHFKASQASSTPATDGEYVVAVFPTAGLACLDLEGKLLWKRELGGLNASAPGDPGMEWGYASSPVIHGGAAIVLVDTYDDPYIAAWELASGKQLWKTRRDGPPSWSTPTVTRTGEQVVVNGATIHGYAAADGRELWRLAPNSELVIATPVLGEEVVYVSAGYAPVKPIYAVRLDARGAIDARPGEPHDALAWSHDRGGAYMPTPLLYRGMLYVVHHSGRMVAYDAGSGDAIYKTRFSAGGTFTASPVAADGKVYIGTEEGLVYVVEAGPAFAELALNAMDEPLMATPALSDGAIYLRTPRHLVAVGS